MQELCAISQRAKKRLNRVHPLSSADHRIEKGLAHVSSHIIVSHKLKAISKCNDIALISLQLTLDRWAGLVENSTIDVPTSCQDLFTQREGNRILADSHRGIHLPRLPSRAYVDCCFHSPGREQCRRVLECTRHFQEAATSCRDRWNLTPLR